MVKNTPNTKNNDINRSLKTIVIGITILTITTGIIFFFLVFKRVISNLSGNNMWGEQFLNIAEKLENDGFKNQAAKQYEKFLDVVKPNLKTRARVSFKIAQIYGELNDCSKSLTWLYQVEAANPKFAKIQQVHNLINLTKKECSAQ